jgi:hypothetical protein
VWTYATRTLTQSAAAVQSAVTGDRISIQRAIDVSFTISGLTLNSTVTKLWFTVKAEPIDETDDTTSILQIEKADGLTYLEGVAQTTPNSDATLSNTSTTVTVTITAAIAAQLTVRGGLYYDVKQLGRDNPEDTDVITPVAEGRCDIVKIVTQSTS